MSREISVLLVDGYIDDPAALGVPPYISPMARAVAGAALDAGADRVEYLTADMVRAGAPIPEASVSVVLSGNTVPGRYLRSMPMSQKELAALLPRLRGWRMVGGSAASSPAAEGFDFAVRRDLAASLYDGMVGREVGERLRTLDEWNRWMLLGADIVRSHQDFPEPLIAEVESYRGCHRWASGGCSYCIEPTKGRPLMRSPSDIVAEASRLRELGVRNLRVGGQTCIVSYGADPDSPVPVPNPEAVADLFEGLSALGFDVLHVDNANPAVIASHPDEAEQVLGTLVSECTAGNVLALGMESADPRVVAENNLNSTAGQVLEAVRTINRVGGARGPNGMPMLLPGINIVCGLDGETAATYGMDMDVLLGILDEGLMVRRINIRQVMPVRREFDVRVDPRRFRRFKEEVREDVDRVMLERVAPRGTVLRDVYMELRDGNTTFGRQIGTYPLLVGVPYRVEVGTFADVLVTDWGYRSVTGVTYPFDVNSMPMSALEALPGIGRRRAQRMAAERPFADLDDLGRAIDDPSVIEGLRDVVVFGGQGADGEGHRGSERLDLQSVEHPVRFDCSSLKFLGVRVAVRWIFPSADHLTGMHRKITESLDEWLRSGRATCPLVYGARRVGKTYSVEEFGRSRFKCYLRLDFAARPGDAEIFDGDLDVDTVMMNITAKYPDVRLTPGETMLFFDEIQECPRARTALKSFATDEQRRYRVVASGSRPGLRLDEVPLIPVGSEEQMFMGPMDFEEYLWAVGMSEDTLGYVRDRIRRTEPFDDAFLKIMMDHLRRYLVVGGMPEAVSAFVDERKLDGARRIQMGILRGYVDDIEKHSDRRQRDRVESCLGSVPAMLAKPNKRFVYADVEGGPGYRVGKDHYGYALGWLGTASLVMFCPNLTEPAEPLEERRMPGNFKLYLLDTGLLVSMYPDNLAFDVLRGDLYVNRGAIVENAVAVALRLQGRELMHYERRERHIGLDFVTVVNGKVTAIELRSGRKTRSASLDKALEMGLDGIVFETGNISVDDRGVRHYPLFAASFLDCIDLLRLPDVDLSDVARANEIAGGRRQSTARVFR